MESNEIIKMQIMQILENQIRDNNPAETNLTFKRLQMMGYDEYDAKQLIGQCIAVEIYNILKHKIPFNEEKYIKNLRKLPDEPFD